ncbi:MAG TPA: hypothetical protein VKV69_14150 [Actinomycetota bacterium]|nr:hypothetical protein [Actinomycetota bacterium]
MRKYPRKYIEAAEAKVDADVAAFKKLAAAARKSGARERALDPLETAYFNNMVLVLDHLFVHRLRTVEGKDGNAMNEVRVLGDSIMVNGGRMTPDASIKLTAANSVLGYDKGNEIKVKEADFVQLAKAFFAEIEEKFV